MSKDTRIFEFRVFEFLDEHILNADQQRWAWCEQQLQLLPLRPSVHVGKQSVHWMFREGRATGHLQTEVIAKEMLI